MGAIQTTGQYLPTLNHRRPIVGPLYIEFTSLLPQFASVYPKKKEYGFPRKTYAVYILVYGVKSSIRQRLDIAIDVARAIIYLHMYTAVVTHAIFDISHLFMNTTSRFLDPAISIWDFRNQSSLFMWRTWNMIHARQNKKYRFSNLLDFSARLVIRLPFLSDLNLA
ncbi:hypothetical protein VNO77_00325 [Canavalia gladiata]|uniref:Uncharacterized protein n=1 Tax=Canavalia gladiata TaxID=3824 RepID=A0AAN9R973_CANGL